MKLSKLSILCCAALNFSVINHCYASNELAAALTEQNIQSVYTHAKLDMQKTQWDQLYQTVGRARINGLGQCGKFSPSLSVVGGFSTGQLVSIGKGVLQNFTHNPMGMAGSAGMAILKQANPGLYEWLEHGISLGFDDYLSAFQDCEHTQQFLLDKSGVTEKFKNSTLNKKFQVNSEDADKINITDFARKKFSDAGDDGVEGVDGKKYGGKSGGTEQPPLAVVNQVVKAGWCTLTGKKDGECQGVTSAAIANGSHINATALYAVFPKLQDAARFSTDLLGELKIKTCENCKSDNGIPPMSLSQVIDMKAIKNYSDLMKIINNSSDIRDIDVADLNKLSGTNYKITKAMLSTAMDSPLLIRESFLHNISFESASSLTIDQVITLRHIILAGLTNATIVKNKALYETAKERLAYLDRSVMDFQQELKLRKELTSLTKEMLDKRSIEHPITGDVNQLSLNM